MTPRQSPTSRRLRLPSACGLLLALLVSVAPRVGGAEEPPADDAARAAELSKSLAGLIATETEQEKELADLQRRLARTRDPVRKQELEAEIGAQREALATTSARIEELATGVAPSEFGLGEPPPFDLEAELQQLAEPFVALLRAATEEARQIERLRALEQVAAHQLEVAETAVASIEKSLAAPADESAKVRLASLLETWRERRQAASDLVVSSTRQLESKLAAQAEGSRASDAAFSRFVRERGRNLALGLAALVATFLVVRGVGRALDAAGVRLSRGGSVRRGLRLGFAVLSVVASIVAMLVVFNTMKDWLLLGLGVVLLLAALWTALSSLPDLIEQATLLLNLGAVQEGERIVFNGVPYLVERLDFHTDLVNPKLRGGHFTLPVRELSAFHSRPLAEDDVWFPCDEGDVVVLDDGRSGRVVFQSPEAVRLAEDGGAVTTFETAAFLAANPKNLSGGYRASARFHVDAAHREIATTKLPEVLAGELGDALRAQFGPDQVRDVGVAFRAASATSLEYDLGADMRGESADRHEDVQQALVRHAVDCCGRNGWSLGAAPEAG